jgi:hypothetical protein
MCDHVWRAGRANVGWYDVRLPENRVTLFSFCFFGRAHFAGSSVQAGSIDSKAMGRPSLTTAPRRTRHRCHEGDDEGDSSSVESPSHFPRTLPRTGVAFQVRSLATCAEYQQYVSARSDPLLMSNRVPHRMAHQVDDDEDEKCAYRGESAAECAYDSFQRRLLICCVCPVVLVCERMTRSRTKVSPVNVFDRSGKTGLEVVFAIRWASLTVGHQSFCLDKKLKQSLAKLHRDDEYCRQSPDNRCNRLYTCYIRCWLRPIVSPKCFVL